MALVLISAIFSLPAHAQSMGLQDLINPGLAPAPIETGPAPAGDATRGPQKPAYDEAAAEWRAGRAAEALKRIEAALKAPPPDPRLRFLRGLILAEQGRSDEAIQIFKEMSEDFPELPEPYNNLAVLHAARGDWNAARDALERSIRAAPGYALAHENLGDIYLQLAARAYQESGRLDTRNDSSRRKLSLTRETILRVQAVTPPAASSNPRPGAPSQDPKK